MLRSFSGRLASPSRADSGSRNPAGTCRVTEASGAGRTGAGRTGAGKKGAGKGGAGKTGVLRNGVLRNGAGKGGAPANPIGARIVRLVRTWNGAGARNSVKRNTDARNGYATIAYVTGMAAISAASDLIHSGCSLGP